MATALHRLRSAMLFVTVGTVSFTKGHASPLCSANHVEGSHMASLKLKWCKHKPMRSVSVRLDSTDYVNTGIIKKNKNNFKKRRRRSHLPFCVVILLLNVTRVNWDGHQRKFSGFLMLFQFHINDSSAS